MTDLERTMAAYARGGLTRRDFARRLLTLGVSVGFIEALLGSSVTRVLAAGPVDQPARTPHIVLVVMDAFRADYVHLTPMPNLESLVERGTTFSRAWVGQLESNTVPSHATISTGSTPANQGVIGFSWRDPATRKETYTGWYRDVMAGRLEKQLREHGVDSIPQAIKRVDPSARVVSVSGEKYYAADAMGGFAADYILFAGGHGPSLVVQGIPHHTPPPAFLKKHHLAGPWPPRRYEQLDEMSVTLALASLRAFQPRVLMINLPACDYYGHRVGGPANPEVMRQVVRGCDRQLGRLIKAYRDRGLLDQTIFIVTGDHGMVPNTYVVRDTEVKRAIRQGGGDYLFHTGGNAAHIWLRNPAASARVARHLVDTLPYAPFAHYQTSEAGSYRYHPVPRTGTVIAPGLERAYQYLLGTFAGPLAPDIALTFDENTIITGSTSPHGEHSGPTWGTQHVPLVLTGPGVRKGKRSSFPARLVDVAPTVLALLGIQPTRMDGVALVEALETPTTGQVAAHDAIAPDLSAYQQAIVARSEADIAAQAVTALNGAGATLRQ